MSSAGIHYERPKVILAVQFDDGQTHCYAGRAEVTIEMERDDPYDLGWPYARYAPARYSTQIEWLSLTEHDMTPGFDDIPDQPAIESGQRQLP